MDLLHSGRFDGFCLVSSDSDFTRLAARIREQGIDRPGVAEIMEAAGLTHGGFYKHFASRDDLIAEATEEALERSDRRLHELTDDANEPLAAFADWYLSAEHRDAPGAGCARRAGHTSRAM